MCINFQLFYRNYVAFVVLWLAVCIVLSPGIIRFTQLVKLLEKQDAEVQRLNTELRSIVLPQMSPAEDPAVRMPAPV